jgi:AAA domain
MTRVTLDQFNSIPATANGHNGNGYHLPRLIDPLTLEKRDPKWLIRNYLPAEAVAILQGHGGIGKGLWTLGIAARVTRGQIDDGKPAGVLISSSEENYSAFVRPKLEAAGADLSRIRFVDELLWPDHAEWLEQAIGAIEARLVIVDPLLAHLNGRVDSYRDHDVKLALRPLIALAERSGCTCLAVHHLTKNTDKGALLSGQASGAFSNTARVVLGMAQGEEDEIRVVGILKSNVGPTGLERKARIEAVSVEGFTERYPRLVDAGSSEHTIDQLLSHSRARVPTTQLRELVLRELTSGDKPRSHLDDCANEIGASGEMLYRRALVPLKREGKLRVYKDGLDGWTWALITASENDVRF